MKLFERIENVLCSVFKDGDKFTEALRVQYIENCKKENIDKHLNAIFTNLDQVKYTDYAQTVQPAKLKLILELVAAFHDSTYVEGATNNEELSGKFLMDNLPKYPLLTANTGVVPILYRNDITQVLKVILQTKDYSGTDVYCTIFNKIDKSVIDA